MGLGKTLMALAFVLWRKQAAAATTLPTLPTLVVCPTSVVGNWAREAARFTPQLQVALLHGDARRLAEALQADLLVTTYGILRRDTDLLAGCRFGVVILDEATEGLAPLIRAEIWRCLKQLRADGQAILVIDKNVAALTEIADRHYLIERGRVVWSGSSQALAAAPDIQHRYLGI